MIDYTVCTPMCPGMFKIVDLAGGVIKDQRLTENKNIVEYL